MKERTSTSSRLVTSIE